jgi:hypothetical protein
MALKKAYKTKTGIDLPSSYWRVGNIVGNKNGLTIYVDVFPNQEIAQLYPCMEQYEYKFVPVNDERWDAQAYVYLKTIDAFKDAVDC